MSQDVKLPAGDGRWWEVEPGKFVGVDDEGMIWERDDTADHGIARYRPHVSVFGVVEVRRLHEERKAELARPRARGRR